MEQSNHKVIILCGKICSGKSVYAEELKRTYNAVTLSCDEITLKLNVYFAPEVHDEVADRVKSYLIEKACDIIRAGADVVLDIGCWSKSERSTLKKYFSENGFRSELHYIKVSDEIWERHIQHRNMLVRDGLSNNYFVDDGLKRKVTELFEEPSDDEIDRTIEISE